jgi:hypothetical protein
MPVPIYPSRILLVASTVLSIIASASMLPSKGSAHILPVGHRIKVGRLAGVSPSDTLPDPQLTAKVSLKVNAQQKKLADDYVEYDLDTCEEISSGHWDVTGQPSRGSNDFATITGTLDNGDCAGDRYTAAAIYYKWTSYDPTVPTDTFAATWTDPDYQVDGTFDVTLIRPTNFHQVQEKDENGALYFAYQWESTSGDLADLTRCQVGEYVKYPGSANPFRWPSPPYTNTGRKWSNPTVMRVLGSAGRGNDTQHTPSFAASYRFSQITARQEYFYECLFLDLEVFPGWTYVPITRTVNDPVRGCWGYTVTKPDPLTGTLYKASISPLPADPGSCKSDNASYIPLPEPDFKTSGAEIALSVARPGVPAGLRAPIFIDLSVSNRSAEMVGVDLGLNGKANLELTIQKPDGAVITRTLSPEDFGSSGEHSLKPGRSFAERLLLNEWYDFPLSGSYKIKMTLLDGPLVTSETANADRPSTEFLVEIGPRDPAELESISQKLADRAISAATIEQRMEAANALSYIRDPVAVDSLARVLQQGELVEHYAVDGLGRIGTPEAIAALTAAQYLRDEDVRAAVRSMLEVLQGRAQGGLGPQD